MSASNSAVSTFVIDAISKTVSPSRATPGTPELPNAARWVPSSSTVTATMPATFSCTPTVCFSKSRIRSVSCVEPKAPRWAAAIPAAIKPHKNLRRFITRIYPRLTRLNHAQFRPVRVHPRRVKVGWVGVRFMNRRRVPRFRYALPNFGVPSAGCPIQACLWLEWGSWRVSPPHCERPTTPSSVPITDAFRLPDYLLPDYPISLFHFGNPPLDLDLHNPPVNLFIFPVHNSDVTNILRAFALATNPSQTHKIVSRRLRTRFRIGSLTIRRPGRHT